MAPAEGGHVRRVLVVEAQPQAPVSWRPPPLCNLGPDNHLHPLLPARARTPCPVQCCCRSRSPPAVAAQQWTPMMCCQVHTVGALLAAHGACIYPRHSQLPMCGLPAVNQHTEEPVIQPTAVPRSSCVASTCNEVAVASWRPRPHLASTLPVQGIRHLLCSCAGAKA